VHKPFSSRVLLERVRAVLRRSGASQPVKEDEPQQDQVIERGHLRMTAKRPGREIIVTTKGY
jgi:two-component system, OmpR family, response regulator ChvI